MLDPDRSDDRPLAALTAATRRMFGRLDGPPAAAPPRLDELAERWWSLPPRVRQLLVGATVAAVALLIGTAGLRSPWGPATEVWVLSADSGWGDDVRAVAVRSRWPRATVPDDAVADPAELTVARLRGPLPAGTVLRRSHLSATALTDGVASGRAAVPLQVDLLPTEVDVGARVDVVAAGVDGRGHVLARDAKVLRVDDLAVWLETSRDEAVTVAGADGVDAVRLVLLPP